MSNAARVPETWELTGDDARKALSGDGRAAARCATRRAPARGRRFQRLAVAGVRDLLVLVEGLIVIVGLGTAFGSGDSAGDR